MDYYNQGAQSFGPSDPYAPKENTEPRIPVVAEEVIKLSEKVIFPVEEYPGYNFIGRLIGPKGSTLKALQASSKSKMSILGKGSTKDKKKEEELSKSEDAEHAHLKEPLHVLIQVQAPQIEAHRRMSAALKEVYKFMSPQVENVMPDQTNERQFNDGGRYSGGGEQLRGSPQRTQPGTMHHNNYLPQGGGPPLRGGGGPSRGGGGGPPRGGGGPPRGGGGGGPPRGGGMPPRGGLPPQGGLPPRGGGGRARGAVDQYGYDDPYYEGVQRENRTGDKRIATANGFALKRFRDNY